LAPNSVTLNDLERQNRGLSFTRWLVFLFTRESSYCFRRVLAIAILFVRPSVFLSVCHTGGSVKSGAS